MKHDSCPVVEQVPLDYLEHLDSELATLRKLIRLGTAQPVTVSDRMPN
jgi:hypothetical protein